MKSGAAKNVLFALVTGEFDSNKSHAGPVTKQIYVVSNTHGNTRDTLIFTGAIKEK